MEEDDGGVNDKLQKVLEEKNGGVDGKLQKRWRLPTTRKLGWRRALSSITLSLLVLTAAASQNFQKLCCCMGQLKTASAGKL